MHGPEIFNDPQIIIFAKLLFATLLGGVIGTERAILAHQAAGTRTFSFVALGSCLFIIVGNYVNTQYLGIVNFDPTHIAAAVVSGIGFIGAGLIIFRGDTLHGVTTAAGLWIVAALGVAVGYGMYSTALFTEFLTLLIFVGVWFIEARFKDWFIGSPEKQQ
jgi:putative Mg2+ transporter-C (MgtC) family protein